MGVSERAESTREIHSFSGVWRSDLDSLFRAMLAYSEALDKRTYGRHRLSFWCSLALPGPYKWPPLRLSVHATLTQHGLAEAALRERAALEADPNFEGWPSAMITARPTPRGVLVECMHRPAYQDAIGAFLRDLAAALVRDGFELRGPIATREVARRYGVSVETVRRWRKRGWIVSLPSTDSRSMLFDSDEVEQSLRKHGRSRR